MIGVWEASVDALWETDPVFRESARAFGWDADIKAEKQLRDRYRREARYRLRDRKAAERQEKQQRATKPPVEPVKGGWREIFPPPPPLPPYVQHQFALVRRWRKHFDSTARLPETGPPTESQPIAVGISNGSDGINVLSGNWDAETGIFRSHTTYFGESHWDIALHRAENKVILGWTRVLKWLPYDLEGWYHSQKLSEVHLGDEWSSVEAPPLSPSVTYGQLPPAFRSLERIGLSQ